ncbi:ABC transporter permease [Rhodoligotrophos ferricapiens]|uniref:ABC transporter permease n=1 Tax=Rhodoligotrophos ferricapiens TaxID=3069264 RepID=UPI00315D8120
MNEIITRRRRRPGQPSWGRALLYLYAGLVFAFLMVPLLIVFPISFSSASYLQFPPPGFSLRWYEAYFQDYSWLDSTYRSLKIAAATTVLATVLGTMMAFSLVRGRYPGRETINQLSMTPLLVPTIIYSVAIYGLFSQLRLIGDWRGIVLAHTVLAIPYVVIIVSASLKTVDPRLEQAAMGLGASRLKAVWRVTLPIIRPALVSAMFLAFVSSFDELVVAMFLGGANMTLPKKMFDNIMNEIDPTIAAVSVMQVLLVCVALGLSYRFGSGARPV